MIVNKAQINDPAGYQWRDLTRHDPEETLAAAYEYQSASVARQAQIERTYGVRYSSLINATEFQHARSNPVDPMHNSFLGLVRSFVAHLFRFDLFEGEINEIPRAEIFTAFFEQALYPGHLGRLPHRVMRQIMSDRKNAAAGIKADQWKRVSQMLPVGLALAWANQDDNRISEDDMDLSEDTVSRRRIWYSCAVKLCAALRILHAHSLSVADAEDAVEDLSQVSQSLLSMGVNLTINWHVSMHYAEFVSYYGPLSGYGTWAFERNNGKPECPNRVRRPVSHTPLSRFFRGSGEHQPQR